MNDRITIYEADRGQMSLIDALTRARRDLVVSAPLIWRLFTRDFVAQFRQRMFGYLWIVLAPLVSIAGYWFMAATGFLRPGPIGLPYVVFLFVGTSIWGVLITTITTVNGGILGNGDLLMRTSVPPLALAVAGLANVVYNIIVNAAVLTCLLLAVRFVPSPFVLLYPVLMAPALILGAGVGLVLASIGVIARDITTIVLSGFGILMFVTPVIYDAKFANPLLATVVALNPLTYMVSFPRELTMLGNPGNWPGYVAAMGIALVCLALGTYCFYLVKDRMIERL